MEREIYLEQNRSIETEIDRLQVEIKKLRQRQSDLRSQYIKEYEHRLPYGTKIKVKDKNPYTRMVNEHICFVGSYIFNNHQTTPIHGKNELISPILHKVKKNGEMSYRRMSLWNRELTFEILKE